MALSSSNPLYIGWGQSDITPELEHPPLITGQFHARVSEGVDSRLFAIALALESAGEQVVFVSVDVVTIPPELSSAVRRCLNSEGLDPQKVILHATHTHTGPEVRLPIADAGHTSAGGSGVDIVTASVEETIAYIASRIAEAVTLAWESRQQGGIAFGIDDVVIARNRRWVDQHGVSTMYGLKPEKRDAFRHIEGYEDHSLNLLATYDTAGTLTGILVNVATPAQANENGFSLDADFWAPAREEIRRRFGQNLYVSSQCSAAGDATTHDVIEKAPRQRMRKLRGRSDMEEIANRIADAVGRILPAIASTVDYRPSLRHRIEEFPIPLNALTQADVDQANLKATEVAEVYKAEIARIEADPQLRLQPRWYVPAASAFGRMNWYKGVALRYEKVRNEPTTLCQIHAVRLGEIAFASNPFEYYVDYGLQIKVRSPFLQTFLIQLAGRGTYVPSPRSVVGGGYGSVPASNPIGPEGGQIIAERTVALLRELE